MAIFNTTPLATANNPVIQNIEMTTKDTEYSAVIPAGCKKFAISIQDAASSDKFRIAFETGKVATPVRPYLQYPGDGEYFEDKLYSDALQSILLAL